MYSLLKSSLVNTLSGVVSLAAGFGSTVLIARLLGAEGTGLTAFGLWLVFSGYALANRGIPSIVLRYLARTVTPDGNGPNLVRQLYGRFIWPVLLTALAFVAYGFSPYAATAENPNAFWLLTAVIFLVYCHAQLSASASFAVGDYLTPPKKAAIGCLIQLPAVVIGAYFFGAAGAMMGYLVRHLPQALSVHKCLKPDNSAESIVTPRMIEYGNNSWLSAVLVVLVRTRVEFLFIGWFFTMTEVGFFAAGITFTSLVTQLAMSMMSGMTPKFGHLSDAGETEKLEKTYQQVLRWIAIFLLPVSLGGAVIMQDIIPLVMGDEFAPAIPTATILMLFVFCICLSMVPEMILQATENSRLILLFNGVSAIVLVALNLALTPTFGAISAAWIKGGVALAGLGAGLWYCQARLGYACGVFTLLKLTVSASACALVAWAVLVNVEGLLGLSLAILLAAFAYLVALRLTAAVPAEDIDTIKSMLLKALPGKLAGPAQQLVSLVGKN